MGTKNFDFRAYLESRPDLKKNWNTPFRALVHYYVFGYKERILNPRLNKLKNKANNYLNKRPDLRKNWNTPFRALVHFYIVSKYDDYIKPRIPMLISPAWRLCNKKVREDLLGMYGDFKKELKQTPKIFELHPKQIPVLEEKEEKKFVLIIPLYYESKIERKREFLKCIDINIAHKRIKEIVVFYDRKDLNEGEDDFHKEILLRNVKIVDKKGRLTYEEAFVFANKNYYNSNIIIANADIYFNETLDKLDPVDMNNQFFCLTRWNIQPNKKLKIAYVVEHSIWSQDAWIFKTPLKIDFKCDFEMGLNHCDSFINYHIKKSSSLQVSNPCLDIQVCHLHLSNHRSEDLVKLANRNRDYIEEQKLLGNYDDGIEWSHLNLDNKNISKKIKIPIFYHIPKCAGTFIKVDILKESFLRAYKKESRKIRNNNEYKEISVYLNNLQETPGGLLVYVMINKKIIFGFGRNIHMSQEDFLKYINLKLIKIYGMVIKPTGDGQIEKIFSLIEDACFMTNSLPHYFTVLREPLSRHQSLFYYLRDVGVWERNYGVFNKEMSFGDYMCSSKVADSWIIRNLTSLNNCEPISDNEYQIALKILSKFTIGFVDNLPKLISELNTIFQWSININNLKHRNTTESVKKESIESIPKSRLDVFFERIKYDQKLYDYFRELQK